MLWLQGYGGNSEVEPWTYKTSDGGFIIGMGATTNTGNIDTFCSFNGNKGIYLKYNSDATRSWNGVNVTGSDGDTSIGWPFPQNDGTLF